MKGPEDWSPTTEVRLFEQGPPLNYFRHRLRTGSFVSEMKKNRAEACKVCGAVVTELCLFQHCREKGDMLHLALEVMES